VSEAHPVANSKERPPQPVPLIVEKQTYGARLEQIQQHRDKGKKCIVKTKASNLLQSSDVTYKDYLTQKFL
jgi:hypothetical protein